MAARVPVERDEQRAVVEWCHAHGIALFAVPNGMTLGGTRRFGQVVTAKRTGMLVGAPDLVLIDRAPRTGQPVAIEMKRQRGSRVSEAQDLVHCRMRRAGWIVIVAYGADDAINHLCGLGYVTRTRGQQHVE